MCIMEALNLAEPARKVAMKIPDTSLTYLSARLLKQVKNDSSVSFFFLSLIYFIYQEYEKQVTEFKKRLKTKSLSMPLPHWLGQGTFWR